MFNLQLTGLLQLIAFFAAENATQLDETSFYCTAYFSPLYGLHPGNGEYNRYTNR